MNNIAKFNSKRRRKAGEVGERWKRSRSLSHTSVREKLGLGYCEYCSEKADEACNQGYDEPRDEVNDETEAVNQSENRDEMDDSGDMSGDRDVEEYTAPILDDSDDLSCEEVSSEFVLVDPVDVECENCRRKGKGTFLEGVLVPESELHAYMTLLCVVMHKDDIKHRGCWCLLNRRDLREKESFEVCWQCYQILKVLKPTENNRELYGWPVFIRRLLDIGRGSELGSGERSHRIWEMLPKNYQEWWFGYILGMNSHCYRDCQIGYPDNKFTDVTRVQYRWIKKLSTRTLFTFFDRYLARPQVLCPFGCSEFLNRCNRVSMEKLFLHVLGLYTDKKLSVMVGNKNKAPFLQGMRSDFVELSHNILHLPGWKCRPRLCFDVRLGPQVLCCRSHSRKSTGRYLHVPRPIGGVLACEEDNRFAPVVARPRSTGYARANRCRRGVFTDSYQTTMANGRYEGFDTLVLSDTGQFDKMSQLSMARDAIALCCRPDIKAHVDLLVKIGLIPDVVRNGVHKYSENHITRDAKKKMVNGSGGTYVSMDDAFALQRQINKETETCITLEDGRVSWCRLPWPMLIPMVHDDDEYGAPFPALPYFKGHDTRDRDKFVDYRILWVVAALLTSDQHIWRSIAMSVRDVRNWKGWGLLYVLHTCYPYVKPRKGKAKMFKLLKPREMLAKIYETANGESSLGPTQYGADMIRSLLSDVQGVKVVDVLDLLQASPEGSLPGETDDIDSIVVVNSRNHRPVVQCLAGFELTTVIGVKDLGDKMSGIVDSRHGGYVGPAWWRRTTCYRVSGRESIRLPLNEEAHQELVDTVDSWDVLVFRRINSKTDMDLRLEYLECCGLPTKIRCFCHRLPLIMSIHARKRTLLDRVDISEQVEIDGGNLNTLPCMVCSKGCYYCCVQPCCSVALCRDHYKEAETMLVASSYKVFHLKPTLQDVTPGDVDLSMLRFYIHEVQINGLHSDEEEEVNDGDVGDVAGQFDIERGLVTPQLLLKEGQMWTFDNNLAADMEYVDEHPGTEGVIPTASIPSVDFRSQQQFIGSHVILNKHASLLIRQKGKLRRNQLQNHFISKIMVRSILAESITNVAGDDSALMQRTTMPLLYPEGSLFPNIFFKGLGDGSIIGALPAALLCDNVTMGRAGIATIHEHMKTRITSTFLLNSYDNVYLLYALDSCLNLGTRGHDTRVLLKRGWDPELTKGDGIRLSDDADRSDELLYTTEQLDNRVMCDKIAYAMTRTLPTFFWTFTVNAESCFGMRVLKRTLDNEKIIEYIAQKLYESGVIAVPAKEWTYLDLAVLREQVLSSSAVLAMRIYENFWNVFRQYIMHSPDKPFGGTILHLTDRSELQGAKKAGNLPHHHVALWLKESGGTAEEKRRIYEQIRGSVGLIILKDEMDDLIKDGYVSSAEEAYKILENLAIFLPHRCHARCMRLHKNGSESRGYDQDVPRAADGDIEVEKLLRQGYRCKVPDNHKLSPSPNAHVFRKIERPHCATVRKIFRELGLLWDEMDPISGKTVEILDERLYAVQHIPPTTPEHGITSPVLARLVLLLPGNQNVQLLDSVLAARYLTKYMIMLDESNRLYAVPPSSRANEPTISIGVDVVPNTKVTSIKQDQEEKKKASRKNFVARIVGAPETTMLILNFEQIFTTHEFVKVVTTPLEERPGLERRDPRRTYVQKSFFDSIPHNLNDVDTNRLVFSHMVRTQWTTNAGERTRVPIRPFHSNALVLAQDQCFSKVTLDSVTQFGLRPPELYWIRHQKVYQECFQVATIQLPRRPKGVSEFDHSYNYCARILHKDYKECGWVDGSFKRVKVRAASLKTLVEYMDSLKPEDFSHIGMPDARRTVSSFFKRLLRMYNCSQSEMGFRSAGGKEIWRSLAAKFLCQLDRTDYPVAYYKRVPPRLGYRFLYSLLLGMGKFTTEMDISSCGTVLEAFIKTDLIDPDDVRGSMHTLLRRYILEHMFTQGGGTSRFDEDLETAYQVLEGALIHDHMIALETPPVLITRLRETLKDEVSRYLDQKQDKLMTFVLDIMKGMSSSTIFPTKATLKELLRGSPSAQNMPWSVDSMVQSPEQNLESFQEQTHCLQIFKTQLHDLVHMNHVRHPKCICIVGGPGCGKTTIMMMGMLHAMCMSLRCMTTALLSNRASQLSGIHWHRIFLFPVEGLSSQTAGGLAEQALANLFRYGQMQLAMIKFLDCLCIDELGPFAAKLLTAGEMVCRRIRNCNQFFGGLFLFTTYDIFQIFPINDIPPLLSPHMMTSFRFCELTVSVRASVDDLDLRELQQLTRTLPDRFTPEKKRRFVQLFTRACSFVEDFDDPSIPSNALYIFGKRKPGRDLRDKKLNQYRTQDVSRSLSRDQQRTSNGEWREASEHIKQQLDSNTREDRELFFVPGFVYEITDNKKGKYSHHQLCMLWDVPTNEQLESFSPISVMIAPSGCTDIPAFDLLTSKQQLVELGWEDIKIGTASQRSVKCKGGMYGKRKQYALRLHVFYTLHVSMGCTLPAICSAVSSNSASPFYLWEKAQVIVLLSRTKYAKNMYFVGNPTAIANDLLNILLREGQYFRHMLHILDVMLRRDNNNRDPSVGTVPPVLTLRHHPFRPIDVPLPSDNTGFCYLLISLREPDAWYIGETIRLGERLNQHNTGIGGALQTKSVHLRPWAMLCFVCGFEGDVNRRKRFEQAWQHHCRSFRHSHRRNPTPQDVVDIGGGIVARYNETLGTDLTMVLAGDMVPTNDELNNLLDDFDDDVNLENDYDGYHGYHDGDELDPPFGTEQFDLVNMPELDMERSHGAVTLEEYNHNLPIINGFDSGDSVSDSSNDNDGDGGNSVSDSSSDSSNDNNGSQSEQGSIGDPYVSLRDFDPYGEEEEEEEEDEGDDDDDDDDNDDNDDTDYN